MLYILLISFSQHPNINLNNEGGKLVVLAGNSQVIRFRVIIIYLLTVDTRLFFYLLPISAFSSTLPPSCILTFFSPWL